MVFFAYSEVFAGATPKNSIQYESEESMTNITILLNETIIIDNQPNIILKYIKDNQVKKLITPLSTTLKTITQQKSKIDLSLIKPMYLNAYNPDKQISVSIILKNQEAYNQSKKIKQKYQQQITKLKNNVTTIYSDARTASVNTLNIATTKPLSKTDDVLVEKNIKLNKTEKKNI